MFIELHDKMPITIDVDSIQAFWYDEEFKCTRIVMKGGHVFSVKESYQEVIDILKKTLMYR